jgi:hypothetical protein
MTDEVWAGHANPWSRWSRFTCLPLIALAVWSRLWIGYWAWLAVLLALLWTWLNPRIFARPESTDNWASKAVLGERLWLNRSNVAVPAHHFAVITVLKIVTAAGAELCIAGLIMLDAAVTVFGVLFATIGKSWFLDRMVWLYQEMGREQQ